MLRSIVLLWGFYENQLNCKKQERLEASDTAGVSLFKSTLNHSSTPVNFDKTILNGLECNKPVDGDMHLFSNCDMVGRKNYLSDLNLSRHLLIKHLPQ